MTYVAEVKYERNASKALSLFISDPLLLVRILKAKAQAALFHAPTTIVCKQIRNVSIEFDFATKFELLEDQGFSQSVIKSMYFGGYEPLTVNVLRTFLHKGDTFIDVGANIGFMSALAAGCVGTRGQVHCFEPVPHYYQKLARLQAINPSYTIRSNQFAVGAAAGMSRVYIHSANLGGSTLVPDFTPGKYFDVPAIRLDQYIQDQQLSNIKLIKIDVEGYEFPVLQGLQSYFEQAAVRPAIVCEIVPSKYQSLGHTTADLASYMRAYGYRAVSLSNLRSAIDLEHLDILTNVLFLPSTLV